MPDLNIAITFTELSMYNWTSAQPAIVLYSPGLLCYISIIFSPTNTDCIALTILLGKRPRIRASVFLSNWLQKTTLSMTCWGKGHYDWELFPYFFFWDLRQSSVHSRWTVILMVKYWNFQEFWRDCGARTRFTSKVFQSKSWKLLNWVIEDNLIIAKDGKLCIPLQNQLPWWRWLSLFPKRAIFGEPQTSSIKELNNLVYREFDWNSIRKMNRLGILSLMFITMRMGGYLLSGSPRHIWQALFSFVNQGGQTHWPTPRINLSAPWDIETESTLSLKSGYQNGWFFRKVPKAGGGGHFQSKNFDCRFWTFNRFFLEKIAI